MSYFVTIDSKEFSSREAALKYLEDTYIVEQSEGTNIEGIIKKVESVLPEGFEVSVSSETNDFADLKIEVGNHDFTIDTYFDFSDEKRYDVYTSIDDLAKFYEWSIPLVLNICKQANQRYDFKSFEMTRYHDEYGNGHFFNFSYETKEGKNYGVTYEVSDTIESFLDQFEQHFVDSLIGEFEEIHDEGYFEGYSINKIPIKGLIDRAKAMDKRIKIEIVD